MRRLAFLLIRSIAALAAALTVSVAGAQEPARIRFVVRDATAQPQPGITIMLDAGDGRGVSAYATDATGATPFIIVPSSVVTVTRVLDRDTTPLSFEMTTLDGLLVIPLRGDLDVLWAYDRASRSVISLPRTMRNEAFPELEVLPAEADGQDLARTPPPAGASGTTSVPDDSPPAAGSSGMFWIILAGLILAGVGVGLLAWALARAARPSPRRPTPRQQGRR